MYVFTQYIKVIAAHLFYSRLINLGVGIVLVKSSWVLSSIGEQASIHQLHKVLELVLTLVIIFLEHILQSLLINAVFLQQHSADIHPDLRDS